MSTNASSSADLAVRSAVDALNTALDAASDAGLAIDLEITTIRAANRPDIVTVRVATARRR